MVSQSIKSEKALATNSRKSIEGARNQVAFIIVDAGSGERTIIWDRDERLSYRAEEAPVAVSFARPRLASRRSRSTGWRAHGASGCATAALIVTADIDNIYEGLPELLPLIDVLIGSREFPHRLTGHSSTSARR